MMNVLKAVWMAKYLLTATICLILICIYFFSVFSVLFLKSSYNSNLPSSCTNAWKCSVTIFDSWYKADGTIGGWLSGEDPSISSDGEYNTNSVRILSDFTFNLVVGILLIEIFSGILTDTFGKIRSHEEELSEIRESRCFICNKESNDIVNFNSHTKYHHNLWDYIMYIYSLTKPNKFLGSLNLSEASEHESLKSASVEVLESIINLNQFTEDTGEYISALLIHYEKTRGGSFNSKPLSFQKYLCWFPFNQTIQPKDQVDENAAIKGMNSIT
jgi:hypothetical protein